MTNKPTLLIISFSEIASDARVLKQVREFAPTHQVTTVGFGPSPHSDVEHISVPLDRPRSPFERLYVFLDERATRREHFKRTYNRIPWVSNARELLRGRRFDVALANDIDTVAVALTVTPDDRVHADLHEFFPGISSTDTPLDALQRRYYEWLIHTYVTRAASWTTVGAGIATAYEAYGLDCGVVANATPYQALEPGTVSSPIRLVHSGNAQPSRQLELIMKAAATTSANVTLDLLLMPNDVAYLDRLKALAHELGSRVAVCDPVAQSELVQVLNTYDVGIHVLPATSFNNENALPNKFFDYVQARLGMLIGPSPEMASVLRQYGLGLVSDSFTVEDIRIQMDQLSPHIVAGHKAAANVAAEALSAGPQIAVWRAAIDRLTPIAP